MGYRAQTGAVGRSEIVDAGAYTVTYDVMDPAGNAAAQVIRTVHVIFDCSDGTVASRPLEQNMQTVGGAPYFIVCSFSQLEQVGADSTDTSLSTSYLLGVDVDASATANPSYNVCAGWAPIGTCVGSCGGADDTPFTGTFDGASHRIVNLFIDRSSTDGVGLFGRLSSAVVINLGVENLDLTGSDNVGGVAGYAVGGSFIRRSWAAGKVTGVGRVGGLVGGIGASTVEDVYATTNVMADNHVGGLLGSVTNSTTRRAYTSGSIAATSRVGGLIGHSAGPGTIVQDTFVAIQVTGNTANDDEVGAVLGSSFGMTDIGLYYDSTVSVINMGSGMLRTGLGTAIDVGGTDPADYFYDPTNPPLSAWDFVTVWTANATGYPTQ